jgi:hypothetical protein
MYCYNFVEVGYFYSCALCLLHKFETRLGALSPVIGGNKSVASDLENCFVYFLSL